MGYKECKLAMVNVNFCQSISMRLSSTSSTFALDRVSWTAMSSGFACATCKSIPSPFTVSRRDHHSRAGAAALCSFIPVLSL
ncbi:hypothetical protein K438DRAFT_1839323 [Mycena galopus ATCC 62051]|nr:hypothetical protein K438DRAFT_1839323 [Mycena galopus ATCC 62051]